MEQRKCLIKSLKNELWNFMVDAHATIRTQRSLIKTLPIRRAGPSAIIGGGGGG